MGKKRTMHNDWSNSKYSDYDSQYSIEFHSDGVTRKKYGALFEHASVSLARKKEVGEYVLNEGFMLPYIKGYKTKIVQEFKDKKTGEMVYGKVLKTTREDFITEMRSVFDDGVLSSCFDRQLYGSVYDSMMQKVDAIKKHIYTHSFIHDYDDCYKRNTSKHKKGDPKIKKTTESMLCLCINALIYENSVEDVYKKLKLDREVREIEQTRELTDKEKKHKLSDRDKKNCNAVVYYCEKYKDTKGDIKQRLLDLAHLHKANVLKRYINRPFNFTSVSFSGRSRKQDIVTKNSNRHSKITTFIELSGIPKYETLYIPVKVNKHYQGNLADYKKPTPDYEYTITFDEFNKQIRVILTKTAPRRKPILTESTIENTVGIDVNMKHNMLTISNGKTVDHNQKLMNAFMKECNKTDELKKKDKNYQPGKRRQRKLDTLKRKYIEFENQEIAKLCKELKEEGINHIVLENMTGCFGKCYVDKDETGVNYNRVTGYVGLSSIKEIFEHIAPNYGIGVSLIHPHYTSQMCSDCGEIDEDNRPVQEVFDCIECHYYTNADFNAAVNIRNRAVIVFLRDKLLKSRGDGTYEPKKLKKEAIKKILLQYRDILRKSK